MSQRDKILDFVDFWKNHGDEKSDTQTFWLTLLRDVFDIEKPEKFFVFNRPVSYRRRTLYADAFITSTRVLIEHKSSNKNLFERVRQSDGELFTPYEQALRYADALKFSERPRWIVTCNFKEFHIYKFVELFSIFEPYAKPDAIIKLEDLPNEYKRLQFLVDPHESITEQERISLEAIEIVRTIRNALEKFYVENKIADWHDYLYKICTRLVFCFYADDSYLFKDENYFSDYFKNFSGNARVDELQKVFDILDTPENLSNELKNFPYVNGGLFKEKVQLPLIKDNIFNNPVDDAFLFNLKRNFSWRMIDPLFLDELNEKLKTDKISNLKNRLQKLIAFISICRAALECGLSKGNVHIAPKVAFQITRASKNGT